MNSIAETLREIKQEMRESRQEMKQDKQELKQEMRGLEQVLRDVSVRIDKLVLWGCSTILGAFVALSIQFWLRR